VKLTWIKINLAQRRDLFCAKCCGANTIIAQNQTTVLLKTMKPSPPVVRAANFPYQRIRPAIRWLMEAAAQSNAGLQCPM
jgi:hypothetical protein